MELSLEDLEIHHLTIETDEESNAIEFQMEGRIPKVSSDLLETVAGNQIVPKSVVCEVN